MESSVVSVSACGAVTGSFTDSTRVLLYQSAIALRDRASELAHDDARQRERLACILSCVMNATSWSEAFINELYSECDKNPDSSLLAGLEQERIAILGKVVSTKLLERVDFWRKCDVFLSVVNKKLDRGDDHVARMELLRQLRHALVHAEPYRSANWRGATDASKSDLRKKLTDRFEFVTSDGSCSFYNQVLSVDCARWAIEVANEFSSYFADLIGISRPPESSA